MIATDPETIKQFLAYDRTNLIETARAIKQEQPTASTSILARFALSKHRRRRNKLQHVLANGINTGRYFDNIIAVTLIWFDGASNIGPGYYFRDKRNRLYHVYDYVF